MPPIAAAAHSPESDTQPQVVTGGEFLYRVAERFGLPVVLLLLVMWWVRSDIVQPLLDAHFGFIRTLVEGQAEHTRHLEQVGRKLDELIELNK
jgi:hypothetical protein